MPDEIFNDGTIPHGSAVITLTTNALGSYDCDDFEEPQGKVNVVKRKNAAGGKSGSFGLSDFLEGSCTTQLATNATPDIVSGDKFTADVSGAKVWIVTDVTKSHPKEGYKVQKISFIEELNG